MYPETVSHTDWPDPAQLHDRDTITVDRIRDDIDGPSHRFVICRGDTVEVFFSPRRTDIGKVTGISHRNHEVRVSFQEGRRESGLEQVASIPPRPKSQCLSARVCLSQKCS